MLYVGSLDELVQSYETIEDSKEGSGLIAWGINQPSLEEVFIRIVNEADASG